MFFHDSPLTAIASRISTALRTNCQMDPTSRILLGVSGGIDSIFLLYILNELGQPVTAAVFSHGLRPEAAEESDFTAEFCAARGIPCLCGAADVSSYAAKNRLSIEAAARELRYRFLFQSAEACRAAAVATAHHANDQAETVLLHILRGTGLDGVSGMRPFTKPNAFSKTIALIRPLLGITRAEIEKAAASAGLTWREDRSNTDRKYTRNRIRADLLPKLAEDYNPQIIHALCRLAENAAADKDVLKEVCEDALKYASFRQNGNGAEWSRNVYRNYTQQGLRLRMLRSILSGMNADLSDIGYDNLKEADNFFLSARQNQTIPFSGGLWLRTEGDKLLILNNIKSKQWKYPQLSDGWSLSFEEQEITEKSLPNWMVKARLHPEIAILDPYHLVSQPTLRNISPGERFDPFGMGGKNQKLSDFFINKKIPQRYRADYPAAADEAGIVWIPGLTVCQRCALRPTTRRILIIKLVPVGRSENIGNNRANSEV